MAYELHLGLSIRPQYTTWAAMRETASFADGLGYDSLWTSDHFIASSERGAPDPRAPNFEAWQLVSAWGALTKRVRVGVLVSAVNYRHPAVVAKMASTLDHITGGRAMVGLGAGWFGHEHAAYGIRFGSRRERLEKLAEAAQIVRGLLDQPTLTHRGRHYQLLDAPAEPKPIQRRLPLLIGGGGEQRTLRIAAQHADLWNASGTPAVMAHKLGVLRGHCRALGRDPDDILPTVSLIVVVRRSRRPIDGLVKEMQTVNKDPDLSPQVAGAPDDVATQLVDYYTAGIRGFIVDAPAPYDGETIERLANEVLPLFKEMVTR